MPDRHPQAFFPGVQQVISCHYTQGHGISPGIAVIMMLPQISLPPDEGNLIITDNFGTVTIPDCKVDSLKAIKDSSGLRWILTLKDRRWRWRDCGLIAGRYNVVDESGQYSKQVPAAFNQYQTTLAQPTKYIPWTLATPLQLATLCLDAMGETGYTIDMPNDASTLPKIDWDYINPAQALQTLCTQFNRRIVYNWQTDSVNIMQFGDGLPLPDYPYSKDAPAYSNLQRPDQIVLVGAPVRWQILMALQAVGEDWDGSIRPIDDLSYTPTVVTSTAQQNRISISSPSSGVEFTVTITPNGAAVGVVITYTCTTGDLNISKSGFAAAIQAGITGSPALVAAGISSSASTIGSIVSVLTGKPNGGPFGVTVSVTQSGGSAATITLTTSAPAYTANNSWAYSGPPDYSNVQATNQLTYFQAKALAQKSVFKWYQIVNVNPANGVYPLIVPGYGAILRKEQIVLQDKKVMPILPQLGDDTIRVQGTPDPYVQSIYDGTYRTQPASCWGSYATASLEAAGNYLINTASSVNLPGGSRVAVPFTIRQDSQMIQFSSPVYLLNTAAGQGLFQPAQIFLETAVQLLDPVVNAVGRYQASFVFPGPATGNPPQFIRREDVQSNIVASYNYATATMTALDSDADYAQVQANYYLLTAAAQYEVVEGRERTYPGILDNIALDGAISQISWEVGSQGAITHASRNGEHETYYPTYPERQRLEYLAAPQREVDNNALGNKPPITDPKKS